jgi:hypothetical protein
LPKPVAIAPPRTFSICFTAFRSGCFWSERRIHRIIAAVNFHRNSCSNPRVSSASRAPDLEHGIVLGAAVLHRRETAGRLHGRQTLPHVMLVTYLVVAVAIPTQS